jgi:hypothetical protein
VPGNHQLGLNAGFCLKEPQRRHRDHRCGTPIQDSNFVRRRRRCFRSPAWKAGRPLDRLEEDSVTRLRGSDRRQKNSTENGNKQGAS